MIRPVTLLAAVVPIVLAQSASGRTWIIAPDGTGDAPTIQAGIDSSAVGDVVRLTCGVFRETEIRMKSGIVLGGSSSSCTILEGAAGRATLRCEVIVDSRIEKLRLLGGDFRMIVTDSRVDLDDCVFEGADADSSAGRALHCESSTLQLSGCVFSGNRTWGDPSGRGAAIHCDGSTMSLEACLFRDNFASGRLIGWGAGIHAFASTLDLESCEFRDNVAGEPQSGVGVYGNGAGIFADLTTLSIRKCLFTRNVAGDPAGGLDRGGALSIRNCTAVNVEGCEFLDNECSRGGGISLDLCEGVTIRGCSFRGGKGREGSAVWSNRSVSLVEQCLFVSNDGKAVWARGNNPGDSDLQLHRCTWFGTRGVGVYSYVWGDITIRHGILAGSTLGPAIECVFGGEVAILCSDVWGNHGGDWVNCVADQADVNGNFSADPLFCDPGNGDFTIRSDSPCAPPGATGCGPVGALPVGCGPIPVFETSWGAIKSRYKE